MNVYITYEKDGYGCDQVERVFLDEAMAQDFVIDSRFKGNAYFDSMQKHELEEHASELITEQQAEVPPFFLQRLGATKQSAMIF